jgi:hypothetical protein
VVLALLSFLIAMTAPRLTSMVTAGQAVTRETSMSRLIDLLTVHLQQTGVFPALVINLVSVDTGGIFHKPMVSDRDKNNGAEVLAHAMDRRHGLRLHVLSPAEAKELRDLGIHTVINLNSPADRNVAGLASPGQLQPVAAGVAVLMTGGGDSNGNGIIEEAEIDLTEADRAHPSELFRIVFGLGPETVPARGGLAFHAATGPQSTLRPLDAVWPYFSLLLPRLKATTQGLELNPPAALGSGDLTAYRVRGSAADTSRIMRRTVNVYARQHPAFFAVMAPEGSTRPQGDLSGWGLDFNGNGAID